jgi:uncharacterized membrane protein YtjA (UPF0391 family)
MSVGDIEYRRHYMLKLSIFLLVLAELIGLIGFGGLTVEFYAELAKLMFWVLFALFAFTLAIDRKRTT